MRRTLALGASLAALVACGETSGELQPSAAKNPSLTSVQTALPVPTPKVTAEEITDPDGKPLPVRLADGRRVTLQGYRRFEKVDISDGQCAVAIDGRKVATMGAGPTEVYTCTRLVAAGAVPPKGDVQRIGLIYNVASPNTDFRTAVVLEEVGGAWRVDETLAGEFDGEPTGRTIAGLRAALAR